MAKIHEESVPDEFSAGRWTIEVSGFEPSTFDLRLEADGSVTGNRQVDDMAGSVSGTWNYAAPILTLDLSSALGIHPQSVRYEVNLTDAGAKFAHGSDTEGHEFILRRS